jgi:4-cresol dehydrogenase (hydroxylating)
MIDSAKQTAGIAAIQGVLGRSAVVRDKKSLASFPAGARPAAIVYPESVEQIGRILAAAQGAGASVQPVCNGDSPSGKKVIPGAIVIDMKRMNKVLEVNSDLAYCLVEPGVTYRQLADYLAANGHKLWVDNPGSPDESVAASFIARQAGYTPYADHHLFQCGLEVMLADGKVVRTGMGAMPKSTCWQLFKFGYGPWIDGLFSQSHNGVVTKVGMWMMPQPPGYQPFMVTVPREQDLQPLLEMLGPLKTNMIIPNGVAIANALHEAALLGKKRSDFTGSGPMAAAAVADAAKSLNLGYWNLYGSLYGLPDNVAMAWGMVRGAFSSIPGAQVFTAQDRAGDRLWAWREAMMRGAVVSPPGTAAAWGGGEALSVHPMTPVDGGEALRLYELSRGVMARHGFDYVSEANAIWRAAHHDQLLPYAGGAGAGRAQSCATELITAQASAGFGQVYADPSLVPTAAATYSANGGSLGDLHRRIKTALDPRGLFASV